MAQPLPKVSGHTPRAAQATDRRINCAEASGATTRPPSRAGPSVWPPPADELRSQSRAAKSKPVVAQRDPRHHAPISKVSGHTPRAAQAKDRTNDGAEACGARLSPPPSAGPSVWPPPADEPGPVPGPSSVNGNAKPTHQVPVQVSCRSLNACAAHLSGYSFAYRSNGRLKAVSKANPSDGSKVVPLRLDLRCEPSARQSLHSVHPRVAPLTSVESIDPSMGWLAWSWLVAGTTGSRRCGRTARYALARGTQ